MIDLRNEVVDILAKMQFFQGQRGGRELWNDKPFEVQEKDLESFNKWIKTIRKYILQLEEKVEPVRGEWVYWKEQCEYCMNRNACPYPENQEAMEVLKQWEKENKFWGSLKLICDYYVIDKDKYYLDNPPECNAKG